MLRPLLLAAALVSPLAPAPAAAQGVAGNYLAARIAGFQNDYRAAARYYGRLVDRADATPQVLENAVVIFSVLGDFERAAEVGETLERRGQSSQFGRNAALVTALEGGDWDAARAALEEGVGGALLDGLLGAWIAAAEGDADAAEAAFEALAGTAGFEGIARLHQAYARAARGDVAGADAILSGRAFGPLDATSRGIEAHAQVLAQLDRRDDALELLDQAIDLSSNPALQNLRARIEAGEPVPYDVVATPVEGMAEAFFILAAILSQESSATFTLLNARAATVLRPGHVDALVLVAELLEGQGEYDLANEALTAVPRDDPGFFGAEIGRASVLLASDREEAAVEVLQALTHSNADRKEVWAAYADALRRLDRHADAVAAYDRAIELDGGEASETWFWVYARGISKEQTGDWPGAEADFRRALELSPEQPQVLNYLGYGLVEQRQKLDEALDLIERAVAARPEDGYITDSLGWVLYRLGRFEEAVAPMERAVMLEPLDPIINDHLGDVLWAVGREREAEFQWRRALSLAPEPEDESRIRRKLELGLDAVLAEEGGVGPTQAADE